MNKDLIIICSFCVIESSGVFIWIKAFPVHANLNPLSDSPECSFKGNNNTTNVMIVRDVIQQSKVCKFTTVLNPHLTACCCIDEFELLAVT